MSFYLNELSLHGQYHSDQQFIDSLKTILDCRKLLHRSQFRLFCRRELPHQLAVQGSTFYDIIHRSRDKNWRRKVRIWLDRDGPFMDEDRLHPPNAYLSLADTDRLVTDTSLGEAAYRIWQSETTHSLSFNPSNFNMTPLEITLHLNDENTIPIELPNFWSAEMLKTYLLQIRPQARSWRGVLDWIEADFAQLILLPSVIDNLQGQVFNQILAKNVLFQLDILNQLAQCFDEQGQRTAEGHRLIENYFQGQRAMFSDESDTNKIYFRSNLTFTKPDGTELFCPFHSKINHLTFRIHFSWPVRHNEPIYIAYIGPKITKS